MIPTFDAVAIAMLLSSSSLFTGAVVAATAAATKTTNSCTLYSVHCIELETKLKWNIHKYTRIQTYTHTMPEPNVNGMLYYALGSGLTQNRSHRRFSLLSSQFLLKSHFCCLVQRVILLSVCGVRDIVLEWNTIASICFFSREFMENYCWQNDMLLICLVRNQRRFSLQKTVCLEENHFLKKKWEKKFAKKMSEEYFFLFQKTVSAWKKKNPFVKPIGASTHLYHSKQRK